MKKNPALPESVGVWRKSPAKAAELVAEITRRVESDEQARSEWVNRAANYYRRRYTMEDRETVWPWPGASDVVLPLIDMTVDRLKSVLSQVIFTRPMVNFQARDPQSVNRAQDATLFFQWLLNEGMPDFREQVLLGLDTTLQYGWSVFKIYWDARWERRWRVITRDDLGPLGQISESASQGNFTGFPAAEFKSRIDEQAVGIKESIARKWNLDVEEKEDKEAVEKIFRMVRNSREKVEVRIKQQIANNPRVIAIDPQDIVVPKSTWGIQDASRITHKLFLSEATLRKRARNDEWSESAVKDLLKRRDGNRQRRSRSRATTTLDFDRDSREGLHHLSPDSGLFEVWEHYTRMDIDGDGQLENVVFLIAPSEGDESVLLRDPYEVPFWHGSMPFVQMRFEVNDPRFYSSRGVPEKIDDLDREVTLQHRAKLNNLDMMVPAFTYTFGSEFGADSYFKPGQGFPVTNPGDIEFLNVPDRTVNYEREEQSLLTWNERYLGGLDVNLAEQGNIQEARTAKEIEAIQQSSTIVLGQRAEVLQMAMKEIYHQIWGLWNQYGRDQDVYIRVTGNQLKKLSWHEIRGQFDIVPIGTVQTVDPALQAQRALQRVQLLAQLIGSLGPQMIGGLRYSIDFSEAVADWLRKDDPHSAKLVLRERSPEEIQALAQQLAQQEQRQQVIEDRQARAQANEPLSLEEADAISRRVQGDRRNFPFGPRQKVRSS